jgi:hypothetical protein
MSWFTLLGIVAMVASYFWLTPRIKPVSIPPSPDRPPSSLKSLPSAEARRRFGDFAEAGDRLTVTLKTGQLMIPAVLGPLTQEFFETYDSVKSNDCGFELDVSEIHASVYIDGFISIGHYEDWDVVQRPGRDDVFVVEGSETKEDEMEWFPTVYHFVVHEIRECQASSD